MTMVLCHPMPHQNMNQQCPPLAWLALQPYASCQQQVYMKMVLGCRNWLLTPARVEARQRRAPKCGMLLWTLENSDQPAIHLAPGWHAACPRHQQNML